MNEPERKRKTEGVICPECGSSDVSRSHRKLLEKLAALVVPYRPYRCMECRERFWLQKTTGQK